jgi:hypothetical protein
MKGAQIGTIFLVSIMALAGIGASYATWFDQTQIDVNATTGTLSYTIDSITQYDQLPTGGGVTITPTWVSADEWQITVSGAYPGWEGRVLITWHNTGSIPMTFDSFRVTIDTDTAGLGPYYSLKFYYTPEGGPDWSAVNMDHTLQYLHNHGWITYASLGIPASAVTIASGATGQSVVGLKLSDTLTDNYAESITFVVDHKVTQAI